MGLRQLRLRAPAALHVHAVRRRPLLSRRHRGRHRRPVPTQLHLRDVIARPHGGPHGRQARLRRVPPPQVPDVRAEAELCSGAAGHRKRRGARIVGDEDVDEES